MKKVNDLFFMRPWAIQESALTVISEVLDRHADGIKLNKEEIEAAIGGKKEKGKVEVENGVAVIPVQGIISKRASMMNDLSFGGGTSTQEIKKNIQTALADKAVHTIALDIDSPGGSVDGVPELADFIQASSKKKKIYAYADGQMASAAYWIGSAAEKIYATKSAEVGSIGVYSVVSDWTVRNHNAGVKREVVKAGRHKAAGHPDKPFTEDDRAVIQEEVNAYYKMFTDAVKTHRGMSDDEIAAAATGKVFMGDKALEMGLIDEIGSIESLMESGSVKNVSAASEEPEIQTQTKQEDLTMDLSKLTLDELKVARPDLCVGLINEGKTQGSAEGKSAAEAAAKTAADNEKSRVVTILEKAKAIGHVDAAAIECVKAGDAIEIAEPKLKAAKLDVLQKNSLPSLAGGNTGEERSAASEEETIEAKADRLWASDKAVREEFESKESYLGFLKAESAGRVRIFKGSQGAKK